MLINISGTNILPIGTDKHGEGGERARLPRGVLGARGRRRDAGAAAATVHGRARPGPARVREAYHRTLQGQVACE